jgi:hypothetical protein
MSIEAGKPYKFVNKRAGLALQQSITDQTAITGEDIQSVIRQSVRTSCPFNSFCWGTHIILVDR